MILVLGLLSILGCKKDDDAPATQTIVIHVDSTIVPADAVADVGGNIYSTVVIGNQRWMAENLRTSHYANGDPIPYVPDAVQWAGLDSGAWTNYDNDAGYDEIHGKLYNWYTVLDARNVCPSGWHVPTDAEWQELEQHLGMSVTELQAEGTRGETANVGGQLKAQSLWVGPNTGATNASHFSALPGGRRSSVGAFSTIGTSGMWWTASEYSDAQAWRRILTNNSAGISRDDNSKQNGASIRCVQD